MEFRKACRGPLAAIVGVSLMGSPGRGAPADELEAALREARARNGLLAVVLVSSSEPERAWVEEQIRRPEWAGAIRPHAQIVVRAEETPSVAARFAPAGFPQFILLDGDGREVGRIQGKHTLEALVKSFRRMVEAAERFTESVRTLREKPLDIVALHWVGTYRWNRGERSLAVSCFRKIREIASASTDLDADVLGTALRYLAQDHLDRGEYAEAEQLFRRTLRAPGGEERACSSAFGLSMSLRRQSRLGEAVLILEEHLKSHPGGRCGEEALFTMGYLERELGERTLARKRFTECAFRYPRGVHGQRAMRYLGSAVR